MKRQIQTNRNKADERERRERGKRDKQSKSKKERWRKRQRGWISSFLLCSLV